MEPTALYYRLLLVNLTLLPYHKKIINLNFYSTYGMKAGSIPVSAATIQGEDALPDVTD